MYYEVASKMVIVSAATSFSQAVSMDGANAFLAEFTNFGTGAGTLFAEIGNDLENWGTILSSAVIGTANPYGTLQGTQIAARYVRLRVAAASGPPIILGAGINTAAL
jgi:hypothetical protein